jgi:putative DNA primase/helicase
MDTIQDNDPTGIHSIPHSQILYELLNKIYHIDFKKLAKIEDDKQPSNSHYQILVIEKILELAKSNNWGLCRNHDFIYLYNGAYWSLLDSDELKTFLGEAAEKMGVTKFKAKHFNFREQLFKQFLTLANLPKPEQLNDAVCINLLNGTFKITPHEVTLEKFDRADFMTYQLPFEYNPDAKAALFEAYLNKVLPDKEGQNIISEYLGYIFVKPTTLKLEKTLLLYGTGANGKSVFYEIVRKLLGDQNVSEYSLQSLTNENGYYRAMIANKLVNYASEINGRLEASIFKQLVSGEPVEARLPYGNPFSLTQYAKLIFNCNELPKDTEQTEAFFRRFLIVSFEVTIPENEQDKELAKKIIESELSGVFNWLLNGLKRVLSQKRFTHSAKVNKAREQYECESDSVKQFVHENGYKASTAWVLIKHLYLDYKSFCIEDGLKAVSKTNFIKRLRAAKFLIEKKNIGNVGYLAKGTE